MFCQKCHDNAFANAGKEKKIINISIIVIDNSWPRIIVKDLENFNQNFDLCENCDNKVNEEMIKIADEETSQIYLSTLFLLKKLYIDSIRASLFFNFIVSPKVLHHTKHLMRENQHFTLYLKDFLSCTYGYDYKIFSDHWQGTNYYYQMLFDSLLVEKFPIHYFNLKLIRNLPLV